MKKENLIKAANGYLMLAVLLIMAAVTVYCLVNQLVLACIIMLLITILLIPGFYHQSQQF